LGQRSRKKGRTDGAVSTLHGTEPPAAAAEPERRPRVRGEARNELIRSKLEPLRPGERPPALLIAIVIAVIVALVNPVLALTGYDVRGEDPQPIGIVLLTAIMLACAAGMWMARYWAVLGFQALLGITVIIAFLSLPFSENWLGVVLCTVVGGLAGLLFWKLVRVMSRMQMPGK
jgi:hypothetical protein